MPIGKVILRLLATRYSTNDRLATEDQRPMDYDKLVAGDCYPRFDAVRRAFVENFTNWGEHGAAVAVTLDAAPVVDLWGGFADAGRTRPWQRDTLVCMMSVAKGIIALCTHMLADRGQIDLDAPVARYWPAFSANGKDTLPVRYLLDHRAGLPVIEKPLPAGAIYKWNMMTQALAEQRPLFAPGSDRADQPVTMGFLVGELIRRVTGMMPGQFLQREVAEPLEVDYHIGLPMVHHERCAEFITAIEGSFFDAPDPTSLRARALAQLPPTVFNDAEFRSAEIPAINGHGTARGVARLYGVLAAGGEANGIRLLSGEALVRATAEQWRGSELLSGRERRMALGFALNLASFVPMGPNPRSFGHAGAGGAIGFADPDARIGFAYAPNRMHSGMSVSPRLQRLVDAVFSCL